MNVTIIINDRHRPHRPGARRARRLQARRVMPAEAGQGLESVARSDHSVSESRPGSRGGACATEVRIIINEGRGGGRGRGRQGGPKAHFCSMPADAASTGAAGADSEAGEAQSL